MRSPSLPLGNAGNAFVVKDENGNIFINHAVRTFRTTAVSSTTDVLTAASAWYQIYTGTTADQTVELPPVAGLPLGFDFVITNDSATKLVTVKTVGSGATVKILAPKTTCRFTTKLTTGTGSTTWQADYAGINLTTGKKLTILKSIQLTADNDDLQYTFPGSAGDRVAVQGQDNTFTVAQSFLTTIKTGEYNVASLPTGARGDRAFVKDASGIISFNGTATGGGSGASPVFHDGSAWKYG